MEKSDTPALTVDEHNNLLLRLTLVQLTSINSRLDNLETQITELLARTTSRNEAETSSTPCNVCSSLPSDLAIPPLPAGAVIAPSSMTRTVYVCCGNDPQGEGSGNPEREIPPDISCMVEAKVQQMREDLLERVGQIMQESTMKTKGVVETSLNKMTDNITGIIDRNLTTMGAEMDTLKHSLEELSKKSRSPPVRDADVRNTMEQLRQNVGTIGSTCLEEMERMKEDQVKVKEEIQVLKEEINQLRVRQSVEGLTIENGD